MITRYRPFLPCAGRLVAGALLAMAVGAAPSPVHAESPADQAAAILSACGVRGGLVVHVGCGDGRLTAALGAGEGMLVHGIDRDGAKVVAAREEIRRAGLYGRVSAEKWAGGRLPHIDGLANLVVCEDPDGVAEEEVARILAPRGVAYLRAGGGWRKIEKSWPSEIDEWTHYLHDASNNAVAQDRVVGPPRHYQWVGSPAYLRHHDHMSGLSAMVSARGRLFYIMDLGPRWSVEMPPEWTLVARDAFNGVILWRRPIGKWHPHLWPLKRGPAQLMRRLVAEGDRVFVTLGVGEPVVALDAASGRTVRTFAGTEGAEEMILAGGVLHMVVNPELDAYREMPRDSVDAIRSAGRDWNWDERPRRLLAVDAGSGKVLWQRESLVAPGTPAANGGRFYFHDGDKVVCLDAREGREIWSSQPQARWKPMHVLFSPTLVACRDVVLFAGGEKMDQQRGGNDTMTALSADTGAALWTAPHPGSGYASAEDLFVINDLVWCGMTTSPRDTGEFTGRDLRTGEVRVQFPADDWKHMPHHRCYRAKATCNYILTSRTGIEFVDMAAKHWTPQHWVRSSCNYGVMPCNGLLYAAPHSCACFLLAKLNGFNALAPDSPGRRLPETISDEGRLVPGPGGAGVSDDEAKDREAADEWPTHRHDAGRGAATETAVPAGLSRLWEANPGGRLSAMTVAAGRAYVASIDAHTIHALGVEGGKTLWTFTADGRVDSPPTVWRGRVLFGSADGHVYCLRAADGALVWRFRAAPADRRMAAFEQVESVWPVHGSVLVRDGAVYCVAGRAMWLDGGMRLLRIDAATGRKLSETVLDDKYPDTDDNLQRDLRWPNLPVALPDVLSCDGKFVYMRSQPFDLEGRRTEVITPRAYTEQRGEDAHLFSATGFLDDSYWHRTYWTWGRSFISGAGGWHLAAYQAPAGNILVADKDRIYGFGSAPLKFLGTPKAYHVFACAKEPNVVKEPGARARKQGTSIFGEVVASRLKYDWSHATPMIARAMVAAGDTLFMAGPPALVDETDAYDRYGDPAVQAKLADHVASFGGAKGGLLMGASKGDGRLRAAYRLASPPVFDGMAAAAGRLFVATMDGRVLCLGAGGGEPLEAAPDANLAPLVAAAPAKPGTFEATASHPDFQHVQGIQISDSDLGYRMRSDRGAVALALRQLDPPIGERVTFRVKVRPTPGADAPDKPGNAFIAFGDGPEEEKLVKCGFRISGQALTIVQGPLLKGAAASKKVAVKAGEVTDLAVEVDLAAQKVRVSLPGGSVEAPLARRIAAITWAGCAITSVTSDFGKLAVDGR